MHTDPSPSRRRLFRGSLEVVVLALLADGRAYGYALRQQIEQQTGQPLPFGTLYPLLHRFETQGWITATIDTSGKRPRKYYELTPAGRASLRKAAADWQAYLARLQATVLPAVRRIAARG
ncbi:MAG: PadR family transcriptional regulator [Planctomycetota bacterium]